MSLPRVVLERREFGDEGTFGFIAFGGELFYTGELPWRENASNASCIPLGSYPCRLTWSPSFKRNLFLVGGVDGRSGVRIHPANLMGDRALGFKSQLLGCIALGETLGRIGNQRAILRSQPAVRRFERMLEGKPFILEIVTSKGTAHEPET